MRGTSGINYGCGWYFAFCAVGTFIGVQVGLHGRFPWWLLAWPVVVVLGVSGLTGIGDVILRQVWHITGHDDFND